MKKMVYDIRTTEYAQRTLTNLTNIPVSVWEKYLGRENEYQFTDDLVAEVINKHGNLPSSYKDFEFIYFHITTSANECESIKKHGILDLKKSYGCHDSELRIFLEKNDIHINLEERILMHRDNEFDITFGACPKRNTEAYKCWSVGRKFYYDFTTCGFLSIWELSPYGGNVHHRPEILSDIDDLLGLNLSQKWVLTHRPYEVVAKVSGNMVIYDSDDDQSDKDKVLNYLTKAYWTAFGYPSEHVLLLKDHIQIPAEDILEINNLSYWKNR